MVGERKKQGPVQTSVTKSLQRLIRRTIFVNEHLRDLKIERLPLESLRPYRRNPRTHSPKQIQQVAASIEKFGFTNPILIDQERRVLAGHGRIEAAKRLGMSCQLSAWMR
jgi:ParB-like chromosome segregation protein Spo0J